MAEKIRDYARLATDIIREVGGESNIVSASRCATRLRLVLKEIPNGVKEKISEMPGVITVVESGGQFQVVIGTHVGDVFERVSEELHLDEKQQEVPQVKESIMNRIIATMSGVFAPFVYILAGAGLLQGILIIINMFAPAFADTGTYAVLSFMSWTPFTFLPIFIAITASKHFKCSTYIAVLCCCALVNPDWAAMAARIAEGESIKFLFFHLSETVYTSSVLPPLILVWVLSYLERFVEKRIPEVVKALFTPLICMAIMVPATILIIGPLSTAGANAIANGYNFLYNTVPAVAGAVIGGFWEVAVIFGVHWGVTPMVLANFDMYGQDSFQAFQTMAVVAQMGAAFGCFVKSRNKEFRGVALSAGITGIFGITEPTIYGVTLRLKKPFICACIAGAAGAITISFFHSVYYAYAGLPGALTIVNAISPDVPASFIGIAIGCAVSVIGAFLLVQFVGFDDPVSKEAKEAADGVFTAAKSIAADGVSTAAKSIAAEPEAAVEAEKVTVTVQAPLTGNIIPLSEIPDEVFSSGMLGKGMAVEPEEFAVYAPFSGHIESIFDTKHAIGLISDDGAECLIHVGLDTVKLAGRFFDVKKKTGDTVKPGDLILTFDGEEIKKAGYPIVTPILISNSDNYDTIEETKAASVKHGELLLTVKG